MDAHYQINSQWACFKCAKLSHASGPPLVSISFSISLTNDWLSSVACALSATPSVGRQVLATSSTFCWSLLVLGALTGGRMLPGAAPNDKVTIPPHPRNPCDMSP